MKLIIGRRNKVWISLKRNIDAHIEIGYGMQIRELQARIIGSHPNLKKSILLIESIIIRHFHYTLREAYRIGLSRPCADAIQLSNDYLEHLSQDEWERAYVNELERPVQAIKAYEYSSRLLWHYNISNVINQYYDILRDAYRLSDQVPVLVQAGMNFSRKRIGIKAK